MKARVVSGMRPTGRLHLGHLVGALNNWVRLQDEYDCFYFVADWHALTSEYADTSAVVENSYDMVADWIAAGLDPDRCTFFVQSLVPEHAELFLLLSMVTPVPWLERVPTYKEQQDDLKDRDLSTIGFLVGAEIEMARLEVENTQLSERLETRKILDRAKGILQRDLGMTEEEAYLTIQRQSRQRRKTKKEIAEAIVLGDELRRGKGGS